MLTHVAQKVTLWNPLKGLWWAVDIACGDNSIYFLDEEELEIQDSMIYFTLGGGEFANGPYSLESNGSYTAIQGEESIKFERVGEQLKVTFARGCYGDPVSVFYEPQW